MSSGNNKPQGRAVLGAVSTLCHFTNHIAAVSIPAERTAFYISFPYLRNECRNEWEDGARDR